MVSIPAMIIAWPDVRWEALKLRPLSSSGMMRVVSSMGTGYPFRNEYPRPAATSRSA